MDVSSVVPPNSGIRITDVKIALLHEEEVKAFVTIVVNDSLVVRGLKVIQGEKGRFVAMPARRRGDGSFQNIAHPIDREFQKYLETVVMQAYENSLEDGSGVFAKLKPSPPTLFGAARLKLGSEEEA